MRTFRSRRTRLLPTMFAVALASVGPLAQAQPAPTPLKDTQPKQPASTPPKDTQPKQPAPAKDAKPAPAKDTQAKFEPPSGPGDGQVFLKMFEGQWTVERNFYPPAGRSAMSIGHRSPVNDGLLS